MAIDKKLKSDINLMMKILNIDHDKWLTEKYNELLDEKKDEFAKKVLEMHSLINGQSLV